MSGVEVVNRDIINWSCSCPAWTANGGINVQWNKLPNYNYICTLKKQYSEKHYLTITIYVLYIYRHSTVKHTT